MSNIRPILRPILRNSLFSSSALALSLVTSAPLLAAEHGENDNLAENANNAEQPESEPNMVIVTGEKLDRTLEETTTSVVIYSGEELERRSIDDLYDVVLRTPNVTQSFGEKGFAIRGIDQRFGGGAGLLVNTIVDGASLPNNQSTFLAPIPHGILNKWRFCAARKEQHRGAMPLAAQLSSIRQHPNWANLR